MHAASFKFAYCGNGQFQDLTAQSNKKSGAFAAAEVKADPVEPPALARVPLPGGALAAVAAQFKQYITAKEQRLLAVASKAATAAPGVATDDQLAQQWQVRYRVCVYRLPPFSLEQGPLLSCLRAVYKLCLIGWVYLGPAVL